MNPPSAVFNSNIMNNKKELCEKIINASLQSTDIGHIDFAEILYVLDDENFVYDLTTKNWYYRSNECWEVDLENLVMLRRISSDVLGIYRGKYKELCDKSLLITDNEEIMQVAELQRRCLEIIDKLTKNAFKSGILVCAKEYYSKRVVEPPLKTYFSEGKCPDLVKKDEDAGYDLRSSVDFCLTPHTRALVDTSLHVSIPDGYYGQIFPRSGLSSKKSIDVSAGVIDSGYRGEIKILLVNNSSEPFCISIGDRVAQLVLIKIHTGTVQRVPFLSSLGESQRNSRGFGSSGVN